MAKSNTNEFQPLTDVVASVSTDFVGSVWSSAFNLTVIPAAGEYTWAVIVVDPLTKGIAFVKPEEVLKVVPPQVCAPAVLSVIRTLLDEFEGSVLIDEEVPPKSVTV